MALGQEASKTVTLNNIPSNTTTKTVELNVHSDGRLIADKRDTDPGVNSATNKNG